jgi:hypothetical protein
LCGWEKEWRIREGPAFSSPVGENAERKKPRDEPEHIGTRNDDSANCFGDFATGRNLQTVFTKEHRFVIETVNVSF